MFVRFSKKKMKKILIIAILWSLSALPMSAVSVRSLKLTVANPSTLERVDEPVSLKLKDLGLKFKVQSVMVREEGQEVFSQLDDMDGDGDNDEMAFVTNLKGKETKTFTVVLSSEQSVRAYPSRVYAEMMVIDGKKNNVPIQSMTVLDDGNPYTSLYHHGVAFESELIALRIYFDQRQTVDAYGKTNKGLELKSTHFYPTPDQKTAGYGDDVLWVGNTLGAGTLRGWNGKEVTLINPVKRRTQAIRGYGPVRTVVDVIDEGWDNNGSLVNMTTTYILYAGHRDCEVRVRFDRALEDEAFVIGVTNVKQSEHFTDHEGLGGCWGTDWPVEMKDSAGHKPETVGLGVYIPKKYVKTEPQPTNDNYFYVVGQGGKKTDRINYSLAFCSANENFGYKSKEAWFDYLKSWKQKLQDKCTVTVQ
jgi:hypothetical protein